MSNKNDSSSEELRAVRWRIHLPVALYDAIMQVSIAEERDPGAVAARWLKNYWRDRVSSEKEISGA